MRTAKQVLNELTMPWLAATIPRRRLSGSASWSPSDRAQARTAALFTQGLQTRGPLELDLGDRIGAL